MTLLSYLAPTLKLKHQGKEKQERQGWNEQSHLDPDDQWLRWLFLSSAMSQLCLAAPNGREWLSVKLWKGQQHAISTLVFLASNQMHDEPQVFTRHTLRVYWERRCTYDLGQDWEKWLLSRHYHSNIVRKQLGFTGHCLFLVFWFTMYVHYIMYKARSWEKPSKYWWTG